MINVWDVTFQQDRYHHIFTEVEDTTDYFPEFTDIPSKLVKIFYQIFSIIIMT